MKKNNFDSISSSHIIQKLTPDEASEQLDGLIDYSVLIVKLRIEDEPRCFDLTHQPKLRDQILALIVDNYER